MTEHLKGNKSVERKIDPHYGPSYYRPGIGSIPVHIPGVCGGWTAGELRAIADDIDEYLSGRRVKPQPASKEIEP